MKEKEIYDLEFATQELLEKKYLTVKGVRKNGFIKIEIDLKKEKIISVIIKCFDISITRYKAKIFNITILKYFYSKGYNINEIQIKIQYVQLYNFRNSDIAADIRYVKMKVEKII